MLIAIANHANEFGANSYPNLETLAREAGLSVRQVQRSVAQLQEMGELKATTRFKTSNLYQIVLPSLLRRQVRQIVRGDKSGPEMSLQPSGTKDLSLNDKFAICDYCGCAVARDQLSAHNATHVEEQAS